MKISDIIRRTITEAQVGRELQHLEDYLIVSGADETMSVLQELSDIIEDTSDASVKWDGIAAIYWGHDAQGEFYLMPQNQWAKAQSLSDVTTEIVTLFQGVSDAGSLNAVIGAGGAFDDLEDKAEESVRQAINNFLNVNLVKDGATVTEGQEAFVKGNLLANDTGVPAGLGVTKVSVGAYAVDGAAVPDFIKGSAADPTLVGNSYTISTSDFQDATVGASTIAAQLGFSGLLSARDSGFLATSGSAIKLQISVQAGQTLTFDYKFGSFDYLPWNDYSFVSLKKVDGTSQDDGVRTLYDVRDLKGPQLFKDAGIWKINNAGQLQ